MRISRRRRSRRLTIGAVVLVGLCFSACGGRNGDGGARNLTNPTSPSSATPVGLAAASFTVDRPVFGLRQSATLTWSVPGASTVVIDNCVGQVGPTGSFTLTDDTWHVSGCTYAYKGNGRRYTLSYMRPNEAGTLSIDVVNVSEWDFAYAVWGVPKADNVTVQQFGTDSIIHLSYPNVDLPFTVRGYDMIPQADPLGPHYISATHSVADGCIHVQIYGYGLLSKEATSCTPGVAASLTEPPY